MSSPYRDLPPQAFWKTGVSQSPQDLSALYSRKFPIEPATRVATAGSCFAQHISAQLRKRGYNLIDVEPGPPELQPEDAGAFGYNLYSARYGNIYTVRQLWQLVQETYGKYTPGEVVWERDGRYLDALRPGVEPEGLDSPEEVLAHRAHHLRRLRRVFSEADVFIFTMGMTECWVHRESGTVFPTAPETVAGHFDANVYEFRNLGYEDIWTDFTRIRNLLKRRNPNLRFLLTVSPVPLAATASGKHVWPATVYSKSVLRAVAGALSDAYDDIDYFPSYEIIATPFAGQLFYDSTLRTVTPLGVATVMRAFFGDDGPPTVVQVASAGDDEEQPDPVCEDALLESFAN